MKPPFYISLLFCCIVGLTACTGPVILEEPEDKPSGTEQNDGTHVRDSVPIIHEGTYSSPYTIGEALTLGRGKGVWVEGYIVGSVSGSMKNGCNYTSQATTLSNILLADTFPTGDENDYLYCLPVELPGNSIERDELNLYDNPDNYHRKVRLEGDITLYYKVVGMKAIADYIFCDEIVDEEQEKENEGEDEEEKGDEEEEEEEGNKEEEPSKPHDPDATRQDTLSIAEGIKLQSKTDYNQVYIKGYIVGYTTTNQKIYSNLDDIKESARTNVVLADNMEETNCNNMIAVELQNGHYIQDAVNLFDNPENLHKQLTVKGRMLSYKGLSGCINIPNGYTPPGDTIVIKDYYFLIE